MDLKVLMLRVKSIKLIDINGFMSLHAPED